MDREALWVTVHGVAKSQTTECLAYTHLSHSSPLPRQVGASSRGWDGSGKEKHVRSNDYILQRHQRWRGKIKSWDSRQNSLSHHQSIK